MNSTRAKRGLPNVRMRLPRGLVLGAAGLVLISCGEAANSERRNKSAVLDSGGAPTLVVSLPATDGLSAGQMLQLTGYHLVVSPQGACENPAKIDVVAAWAASISQSLPSRCNYLVTLELGQIQGGSKLVNPVFTNVGANGKGQSLKMKAGEVGKTVALSANFFLTDAGRKAGFPELAAIATNSGDASGEDLGDQTTSTGTSTSTASGGSDGAVPTPPSASTEPPPTLTDEQNVTLTAADGSTQKLAQYFTTKYLLIAASQSFCPGCINRSNAHEADEAFKASMQGPNCRYMTALPDRQVADWMTQFSGKPFIAATSFGIGDAIWSFIGKYDVPVQATPTFILLDRTGKTVTYGMGGVPSKVKTLCSGS